MASNIESFSARRAALALQEQSLRQETQDRQAALATEKRQLTQELLASLGTYKEEIVPDSTVWEIVDFAQKSNVNPLFLIQRYMLAARACISHSYKNTDYLGTDDPMELINVGFAWITGMGSSDPGPFSRGAQLAWEKAKSLLERDDWRKEREYAEDEVNLTRVLIDLLLEKRAELVSCHRENFWKHY